MFISVWLLIAAALLLLYRVSALLKKVAALKSELAVIAKHSDLQAKALEKYQEHIKQETNRAWNVRFGLRNTLGNGANPEVLKRLHDYVFDESATDHEFDWRD